MRIGNSHSREMQDHSARLADEDVSQFEDGDENLTRIDDEDSGGERNSSKLTPATRGTPAGENTLYFPQDENDALKKRFSPIRVLAGVARLADLRQVGASDKIIEKLRRGRTRIRLGTVGGTVTGGAVVGGGAIMIAAAVVGVVAAPFSLGLSLLIPLGVGCGLLGAAAGGYAGYKGASHYHKNKEEARARNEIGESSIVDQSQNSVIPTVMKRLKKIKDQVSKTVVSVVERVRERTKVGTKEDSLSATPMVKLVVVNRKEEIAPTKTADKIPSQTTITPILSDPKNLRQHFVFKCLSPLSYYVYGRSDKGAWGLHAVDDSKTQQLESLLTSKTAQSEKFIVLDNKQVYLEVRKICNADNKPSTPSKMPVVLEENVARGIRERLEVCKDVKEMKVERGKILKEMKSTSSSSSSNSQQRQKRAYENCIDEYIESWANKVFNELKAEYQLLTKDLYEEDGRLKPKAKILETSESKMSEEKIKSDFDEYYLPRIKGSDIEQTASNFVEEQTMKLVDIRLLIGKRDKIFENANNQIEAIVNLPASLSFVRKEIPQMIAIMESNKITAEKFIKEDFNRIIEKVNCQKELKEKLNNLNDKLENGKRKIGLIIAEIEKFETKVFTFPYEIAWEKEKVRERIQHMLSENSFMKFQCFYDLAIIQLDRIVKNYEINAKIDKFNQKLQLPAKNAVRSQEQEETPKSALKKPESPLVKLSLTNQYVGESSDEEPDDEILKLSSVFSKVTFP